MTPPRRRFHGFARKVPGKDSARAKSEAMQFLCGARSLEQVTVDWLTERFTLSPKLAEVMLVQAKQRRADG